MQFVHRVCIAVLVSPQLSHERCLLVETQNTAFTTVVYPSQMGLKKWFICVSMVCALDSESSEKNTCGSRSFNGERARSRCHGWRSGAGLWCTGLTQTGAKVINRTRTVIRLDWNRWHTISLVVVRYTLVKLWTKLSTLPHWWEAPSCAWWFEVRIVSILNFLGGNTAMDPNCEKSTPNGG